jgi:hypothetical protein
MVVEAQCVHMWYSRVCLVPLRVSFGIWEMPKSRLLAMFWAVGGALWEGRVVTLTGDRHVCGFAAGMLIVLCTASAVALCCVVTPGVVLCQGPK